MLILVRHGQTANNRSGLLQGRVDAPLTELGVAQAGAAARALATCGAIRVLTSPLVRARDTAAIVGETLGIEPVVDDRLIELDYGDWDERPLAEIGADTWAAWRADPFFAPPGGESLRAVSARVSAFSAEAASMSGVTVAVSHVSPIKAAVAWALGCDEQITWRMHLDLASITRIRWRGGRGVLASFNETPA